MISVIHDRPSILSHHTNYVSPFGLQTGRLYAQAGVATSMGAEGATIAR